MICDVALARLDALLDGSLAVVDREETLRHVAACDGCRDLLEALAAARTEPEDPGLADSILARTSGSACATARSRLCARVDGDLDVFDAELVDGHVGRCAECASVASALDWAAEGLPRLAEIDPGPGFVEQVLARTSRDARRIPLGARLVAVLARLLERPRVAWEGAFVATVILCAPVLAPGSPLAAVPGEAAWQLRGKLSALQASVVLGARDAWASTGALAVEDSAALASGLARDSVDAWESIRRSLGTFPDPGASDQTRDAEPSESRPAAAQEDRR